LTLAALARKMEALGEAQSLAIARDNPYIEPVHVLSAMLSQDDGPRALLERAGVKAPALKAALDGLIAGLPQVSGSGQTVQAGRDLVALLQALLDDGGPLCPATGNVVEVGGDGALQHRLGTGVGGMGPRFRHDLAQSLGVVDDRAGEEVVGVEGLPLLVGAEEGVLQHLTQALPLDGVHGEVGEGAGFQDRKSVV